MIDEISETYETYRTIRPAWLEWDVDAEAAPESEWIRERWVISEDAGMNRPFKALKELQLSLRMVTRRS